MRSARDSKERRQAETPLGEQDRRILKCLDLAGESLERTRAWIERCNYCGSSGACGCDELLTYEQVRDNPTLIAR